MGLAAALGLLTSCQAGSPGDEGVGEPPTHAACQGLAVRATIALSSGGEQLLSAALVDDPARSEPGTLEVLDGLGEVVATAAVPRPQPVSIIAPPGEEGGVASSSEGQLVTVVAPWPAGAHTVRLGSVEVSEPVCACLLGKADGTRVDPELVAGSGATAGRFDIVVLGDGYRAAELGTFRSDADRLATDLLGSEPYATYRGLINVWRVPVASTESGAGRNDQAKKTAYGCRYGCFGLDRLICCNGDKVHEEVQASLPSFDAVLLLVNDSEYGGAGDSSYASVYHGPYMSDVARHELSHQHGLRDEYTYANGFSVDAEPGDNCAGSAAGTPWQAWNGESGVGAFQGCASPLWFRPTDDGCLMKALGKPLCPICREHVVTTIVGKAGSLATAATPSPRSAPYLVSPGETTFSVTPATAAVEVQWWFGGAEIDASGPSYTPTACAGGTLTARLVDRTPWVRNDPQHVLTQEVSWTLACGNGG